MARRLVSVMVPTEGGPRAGGSGTEVRFYDDEALTTLSTPYQRATGAGTQPNGSGAGACLRPNAGANSALLADRLAGDAFVTVVDVTNFQVGDLVPVQDAVNTVYRVITIITPATKRLDLDSALGFAFLAAGTRVGNEDMKGHIWAYLDDVRDYHVQVKDIASGRLLPPVSIPVRTPTTTIDVQDEGTTVGSRGKLNFIGPDVTAVDNPGQVRVDVTIQGVPVGATYLWPTDTAPTNYLLCYGQAVSRTTYAALFALIGTVFGVGDGATTFNLPDMRGRVPVGQDDMGGSAANRITAANAVGVSGGASTHTLTTSELPSHSHSHNHGSHGHQVIYHAVISGTPNAHTIVELTHHTSDVSHEGSYTNTAVAGDNRTVIQTTTPTTDATTAGSGSAHNIVQPYLVWNYVMRAL